MPGESIQDPFGKRNGSDIVVGS